MPSTIETIDRALFDYIDDELNIFCTTNKGFKKIPFIWVGAERAYQIKHNKDLRDANGWLIYPIMTLERISVEKECSQTEVRFMRLFPNRQDIKGGTMTVARVIKQDKTANFANADSKRLIVNTIGTGQKNFPRKNKKVVYETITMPIPIYIEAGYTLTIKSEYQQQINEAITPFMTSPGGPNYFNVFKDGHQFEVFIEPSYELNNNAASMNEDARGYETQISLKVRGYIIGGDKNEDRPKIVRRENAVEVKLPREYVIFGDIPEHLHTSGNVPFYRE